LLSKNRVTTKGRTFLAELDEEIRRRREQRRQRTPEGEAQIPPTHQKLKELFQLITASEELRREGTTAQIQDGRITLLKQGGVYGQWLIHDAWFEYRGQVGNGLQIHKAAWVEEAIALTASIVTGVHVRARRANGRIERSRVGFSVKQDVGSAIALAVKLVDGDMPSLGTGQLALSLQEGTDLLAARRIAHQLNRDILAMTFKRQT
jgi:hypothetical protein